MRIAIGYDPNAKCLVPSIKKLCENLGHEIIDYGSDDPIYANTAITVGEQVANGYAERGILICGTGVGMSIAANKVKGVYAALLTDVYSARRAVLSNNANVACLGAFTLGEKLALVLLEEWLSLKFNPQSPSAQKVKRYCEYDMIRK